MSRYEIFGTAAIVLQFVCLIPYFIGIFKGRVKPHGFSWMLWGLLSGISFAIQLYEEAGAGAWLLGTNIVLSFSVALLAFRFGTFRITRADWVAFAIALTAIPLWILTQNPVWSLLIACGINVMAGLPTYMKAWRLPRDEYVPTFFLGGCAAFLSIAALDNLQLTTWLYPFVIGCSNMLLVSIILWRRKSVNN